ncbi:TonB-dependent siderophore receptor [Celerinatantimonas sp. MCCC 1A17872]|uniref:TonB-dependent siderophore receptor n=1 Tax=Celerinatantimonas sp. MCCC 1A17872 TaxID=3177514 RepID=UPI0038C01CA4
MDTFKRSKLSLAIGIFCASNIFSPAFADDSNATTTTNNQSSEVTAEPQLVVQGQKSTKADEYSPKEASLGALGKQKLLDLPYSATVLSEDLLEDRQISGLNDALKYDSSTQMEARGGVDIGRPQSRGMEGSVVDNSHIDGMNAIITTAQPMELFERVEIIHSLTGAVYGPATPAGSFNFAFKRPTKEYLNKLTAGYSKDGAHTLAGDFGGSPSRYVGYRFNVLKEQGDGYVSGSSLNRKMAGGALDFHPFEHTTIELNGSYYKYKRFGYPGGFSYSASTGLPKAFDPKNTSYSNSAYGPTLDTTMESAKLIQQINSNWSLTAGVLHQIARRTLDSVRNTIGSDGTVTTTTRDASPMRFVITSNTAHLNGTVHTGSIKHSLVVGTSGYNWDIYRSSTHSSKTKVQSFMLSDHIDFNRYFSTLLIGSYGKFDELSYSDGKKETTYKDHGLSSTVSLMYKPFDTLTTYIAHADTLEAGSAADDDADNAGEVIAPLRSKQWEIGANTDWGLLQGHLALFHLTRPYAYTNSDTNIYGVQGKQRNNGIELSLNGSPLSQVEMMGSLTYIDAKLKDGYSEDVSNKRVVGVPRYQANLLSEYDFRAIEGLSLNADVHYVGKRAADSTNATWAGSYTTLDLGAKYVTDKLYGKKLTVRLNATNVTNRKYWVSIFPGSIYGDGNSASAFLGAPLQMKLSATLEF